MGKCVNKVMVLGYLGYDPKIIEINGGKIVHLSLATKHSFKNKKTEEFQEETEWHKIVLFNKLADIGAQYLNKGDRLYIEGSLKTDKYEDKNNIMRYNTRIIARDMVFLNTRQDANRKPAPGISEGEDFSDDVPF